MGNLHANMDEIMLRRIFETFGKIKHIRVERDQTTGESKEFAHVTHCWAQSFKKWISGFDVDLV